MVDVPFEIISPKKYNQHGGHLALRFNLDIKPEVVQLMIDRSIVVDYRVINETQFVMRAAFVAMYSDLSDADRFVEAIREINIKDGKKPVKKEVNNRSKKVD